MAQAQDPVCRYPASLTNLTDTTQPAKSLCADILEAATGCQAHWAAPLHIVAPWLECLSWLADARWRKLGAAAPLEQVQQLLDCLQGHVGLLWIAAPSTQPGSHDQGMWLLNVHAHALPLTSM